jgi:hypothetical protein
MGRRAVFVMWCVVVAALVALYVALMPFFPEVGRWITTGLILLFH